MKKLSHLLFITSIAILILTSFAASANPIQSLGGGGVIGILASPSKLIPNYSTVDGSLPVPILSNDTITVTYTFINNTKDITFSVAPLTLNIIANSPTITVENTLNLNSCLNNPIGPSGRCTQTVTVSTHDAEPGTKARIGIQVCDTNTIFCSKTGSCNGVTVFVTGSTPPPPPPPPPGTTGLAISLPELALSSLGGGGIPRILTITNTGSNAAQNLTTTPANLPIGTSFTSTCGSTLAPGATCNVTITPGPNASSSCTTGIAPVPGTLTVTGSNVTTPASANVVVLGYGCIYQGGYVFAINDTTPNTISVAGTVLQTSDESNSVLWNNPTAIPPAPDADIPGIDETSTPPPCNGANEGSCDTSQIVSYYTITQPTSPINYAAGICTQSSQNGFQDWFLPAICQLGTGPIGTSSSSCGSQNVQTNLVNNNDVPALSGLTYWSATEDSASPTTNVWVQNFLVGGGVISSAGKSVLPLHLRCTRFF